MSYTETQKEPRVKTCEDRINVKRLFSQLSPEYQDYMLQKIEALLKIQRKINKPERDQSTKLSKDSKAAKCA